MKSSTLHPIRFRSFAVLILTMVYASITQSQSSETSQVLTLQVQELNSVLVGGRTLSLRLEQESFHEQRANASSSFTWTSNADFRKIAVSCSEAGPAKRVRVSIREDLSRDGKIESEIELADTTPRDLIRAAAKSAGACTVEFSVVLDRSRNREEKMLSVFYTITSG